MICSFLMETRIDFSQWLQNELDDRHWIQADLARKSGLSTGQVSRLLTGTRDPGGSTCLAIARAFRLPVEIVLKAAGILPAGNTTDESTDELYELITTLPADMRKQIQDYIHFLIGQKRNAR